VNKLVIPFLKKLKSTQLDEEQANSLAVVESNLIQITSAFSKKLFLEFSSLTATEIQIANLLKEGKSSKEIAKLISSKVRTVEFHRANLRKKLGLTKKNENLRYFLLSI
jgi:DNA-binding CsgD family transcriptional regulator